MMRIERANHGASPVKLIFILLFIVILGYVSSCSYISNSKNGGFEKITIGTSKDDVILILGSPSIIEKHDKGFFRYASSKCEEPCVVRIWYENKFTFDIEAWSFEFNKDNRVIKKTHWISP